MFDDSNRNILGCHETRLYKKYNLSPNQVDILSFGNKFLQSDIAKEKIHKQKRNGIYHNWTMTVNPCYKYVEFLQEVLLRI